MFSITSENVTSSDLKNAVENARQTRPFEFVELATHTPIPLQAGYQGTTILKDSYFFAADLLPNNQVGDRILLTNQNKESPTAVFSTNIENGVWVIMSKVLGYINIQRPPDYAKNTPIRQGQCVLAFKNDQAVGVKRIYINTTPEFDDNQNKIIGYNGTSPQRWQYYRSISDAPAFPPCVLS